MSLSLVIPPAIEPITVAEARRQILLNASAGEPAPTAPTVSLASPPAAGLCEAGAWRVGFTFVTADGETELGPLSGPVTVIDPSVNGQVLVTAIALGGSAVIARRGYAVPPAGGAPRFFAELSNNVDTSVVMNLAAASLGVDAPVVNTTEDPELVGLITAVRERGEAATQRAFVTQTWDYVLDTFPEDGFIEMPKSPLQAIVSIEYLDMAGVLQTWDPSRYVVEAPAGPRAKRGRVALPFAGVWPITLPQMGAIRIRFRCGYGTPAEVPALLKQAMKLDLGTLSLNREGVVLDRTASPEELPAGVRAMYWMYRSHSTQRVAA
jgi:uncharacterized phiE125 gp8 family phage protein